MAPTDGRISKRSKVNKAVRAFDDNSGATSRATSKAAAAALFPSMQNGNLFRKKKAAAGSLMQSSDIVTITPYRSPHSTSATTSNSIDSSHESQNVSMSDKKRIASWGFPSKIVEFYRRKGITEFFDWQVECLLQQGVLQGRNLVYSAPTSAGKSMVSDVLLYKTLLERKKKAIIILPYVSITVEKVQSFKQLFRRMGICIESFAGSSNPRGGLERVDVAVCTIEKANNMLNRLIEEDKLSDIGIVVVDELHMVGDSSRGYLLELLLSKLNYLSQKAETTNESCPLQIVGMSATIPNLSGISRWLDAELYITEFRPVPLYQKVVSGLEVYQLDGVQLKDVEALKPTSELNLADLSIVQDEAPLIYMAIDTLISGFSALVFCPTKKLCEKLSEDIAKNIFEFGAMKKSPSNKRTKSIGNQLFEQLDASMKAKIKSLIQSLKRTSSGIDPKMEKALMFRVAFHHAGLSTEERALIENAYREGTIRILCATTTLSAGVNMPARRVLISSPYNYKGVLLDVTTFRQMTGRAGRMGLDEQGEALLFCKPTESKKCMESLVLSDLAPIKSCLLSNKNASASSSSSKSGQLEMSDNFKRAILEVISNGMATKYSDICKYIECTFFHANFDNSPSQQGTSSSSTPNLTTAIDQVFDYLLSYKLIYLQEGSGPKDSKLCISSLGKAIVSSGVTPDEGTFIMTELGKARRSLCLANDLHLIYQITPTYVAEQLRTIDWDHYLDQIFCKLDADCTSVANLLGIKKGYFFAKKRSSMEPIPGTAAYETLLIYKRFYASLALYELVQESSIATVALKYKLEKGLVQSLQQQAAIFAGMVSTFCGKLGWSSMQLLIEQFQPRLSFGIKRELIDLMRISFLTSQLARQLFSKGYETLVSLIYRKESDIEKVLIDTSVVGSSASSNPAASKANIAATTTSNDVEDPALATVFIPNLEKHLTIRQLAQMIRQEARTLVEADIGQKLNFEENDSQSEEEELISSSPPLLEANRQESSSQSGPLTASTESSIKDRKEKQVKVVTEVSKKQPSVVSAFPVRSSPIAAGKQSPIQMSSSVPYHRTSTPNEKQIRPRGSATPKLNLTGSFVPETAVPLANISTTVADYVDLMLEDDMSLDWSDLEVKESDPISAKVKKEEDTVQPPNTSGIPQKATDSRSVSLMSFGESFDDISWENTFDQAAKKREDIANASMRSVEENDPAEEVVAMDLGTPKGEDKRQKALNRTLSGSPILFESDDSCMAEDAPREDAKPVQVAQLVKCNLKRPRSNSNIPDDDLSSGDLSDINCDDLVALGVKPTTSSSTVLATVSHKTRTTSIDNISTYSEHDSLDDIEFFQSFRQNSQQRQLPTAFEATTKFRPVGFKLIEVITEQHVKQLIGDIFAEHVLTEEGSVLDLAMHFTLQPIKEPFIVKPQKKGKTHQQSQERMTLRIEDRYPVELSHLYLARLGNMRVYHINNETTFKFLQEKLLPRLAELDADFKNQPTSGPSQSLSSAGSPPPIVSFTKPRFRIYTYDVKKALYILQYGFRIPVDSLVHRFDWHDVSVAIWLLDPEAKPAFDINRLSLQDILERSLQFQLPQVDYLQEAQTIANLGKARFKPISRPGQGQVCPSECFMKAALLFYLTGQFCQRLNDSNLYLAYKLIEMPCRVTLYLMETQGITVDAGQLSMEQNRLSALLKDLEDRIYDLAGGQFNLDSPQEVAHVLYKEQNLLSNLFDVTTSSRNKKIVPSTSRRLPKSLSTSKLALIKLQEACGRSTNLPTLIMEWRRVNHALTQTVNPIRNALRFEKKTPKSGASQEKLGLIYGHCDEWTVTGRISMHDPNLINVDKNFSLSSISVALARHLEKSGGGSPVETAHLSPSDPDATTPITIELRRNIRAREGYQLVSADYAQLELRILAHFSKDPCLRATLNNRENDVFKSIAASWKNISLEKVTNVLRQQAKQICYGIIYGIGDRRLADNLAVSETEAAEFRDSFLQRYSQIKTFEEQVHDQCSVDGYVETISNRRRPIANIFSDDQALRAKGQRQAVNTKIQGSAADITKLAMVAVDHAIRRSSLDSVLLLQMHDELMYEVRDVEDSPQRFARLLQTKMEMVSRHLNVILPVKVKIGPNWGQLEDQSLT